MTDEIRLTLPAEQDFRHIAHLVVAGLGARLDLTLERLEDLQVAIEAVLACRDDENEIVVSIGVADGVVRATVGPFPQGALEELEADGSELGLRRVLETVCDTFEVDEREGGSWIELTKIAAAPAEAGS